MGNTALTTKIPVKDRDGNTIGEKEVATYAGLLAKAHEEGLKVVTTKLLQVPDEGNRQTAIVEATVETSKGSFAGIGDASPQNVNRRVAAHLIRMAETRAKARALRDAVNIGMVAIEELGGEDEIESAHRPAPNVRPLRRDEPSKVFPRGNTAPPPAQKPLPARPLVRPAPPEPRYEPSRPEPQAAAMTENQRRWLYRYLSDRGLEGDQATEALCHAAEVSDIRQITKATASQLIDTWKRDAEDGHAA